MTKITFAVDIDGTITEDGDGMIHLDALGALRRLTAMGHNVIFVTGRSSVEGFLLSLFGGATKIAVGENGGCITLGSDEHILLGDIKECRSALTQIMKCVDGVQEKKVFPRMTEIVLERTFDLNDARRVMQESRMDIELSDSGYAYHINSPRINKGSGFSEVMKRLSISPDDVIAIGDSETDVPLFKVAGTSVALGNASDHVRSKATMSVSAEAGDGVLEALDKLAPRLWRV